MLVSSFRANVHGLYSIEKIGVFDALTELDRKVLVKYGLRIKDRLTDVVSIVKPKTILDGNRRMKAKKWAYDTTPKKPGRPRKSPDGSARRP